jgi:phospholipid transport system substrate-binding protein
MKVLARLASLHMAALFLLALCATAQAAATSGPDALVQSTVDDILAVMKKNPDNKRVLRQMAEEKVIPRFDFRAMTRLAVGRPWRDATPAQQDSLEAGFRSILVNTYTAALNRTDLKNVGLPSVEVRPVQLEPNQTDAVVKTLVRWQNGQRTAQVDYRMSNTPDGWKITDVVVEGLSLVVTYRSTFAETINRSGIPGLINALEEKNRAIAGG